MSEFGGGSSEVSESTEVNETPPEETGGESSEATQEAVAEEANESGGFDDAEDTEASDSCEDTEDIDSEDDGDESQDVGFEDGNDVDNTDSQPDDSETYEDDNISDADEDQVGFDDSEEPDGIDDGDIKDEDPEFDSDGSDADEDPDGSPDGEPDGEPVDDSVEDDQDIDDDFDAEDDTGELEDYSEDPEDETVEDDQDVDDDADIEDEDPEVDPDGNEADEDPDGSPEGDPDGEPEDDTIEDDQDIDDDFDDEEDSSELEDYSEEPEDDQDVDDDADIEDEDPEVDPDGNEADEASDGSPEGDLDGDPEDDTIEDDQDVDDDTDIENEDPEVDPDGNEADEDPDGSPEGDPDGEPEDDTIEDDQDVDDDFDDEEDSGELEDDSEEPEDDQDVDDDADIEDEDPEVDPDGNEADEDPNDSPDGDLDGDSEDDTIEDDQDVDDDFDDEEDSGELEDDSDDPENSGESNDEADDEAERDQEKEELAEEKANEEAAEEAEDAVSEDANKLAEDEADPVEDENQKLLDNQPEDSVDSNASGDELNEDEHVGDTPKEENEPEQDADSMSEEDYDDELEDSEEYQDEGEPENYDDKEAVDPVSDNEDKQEASAENDVDDQVSKTAEDTEKEDAYRTAMNNMADYLNAHNYGREDYAEYSKDPEWQKLNADLKRSLGMEVTTDVPETAMPSPESGKDVSSTELPDNCVIVNASDIDMTYAQGMDSDQFWNHHGNTEEDYMRVAEKLPDVQQALDSGKSIDELKNDPELGDTVRAYYDPDNLIKVEQKPDGSYSFTDDGRHRIAAAQEYGYQIPVEVTNLPEQANTSNEAEAKPDLNEPPVDGKDDVNKPAEKNEGNQEIPPVEGEFGGYSLNVADVKDDPSWVKASEIKDRLHSIGESDTADKLDEAIKKVASGENEASPVLITSLKEAGNKLVESGDPQMVECGNSLLNMADEKATALKEDGQDGSQFNGLKTERSAEGASEAPNPDDLNRKQDIGSETLENLGSFEQNKWDNLSPAEKEQAIEKLRDSIAEDLQLENKPYIAYYYKESPSDFGGYAASTNTIYINRFNMDNAGETADTIAHESRHCWQHERAENPQTAQDYRFKDNFENYAKPEENFEEYLEQPVEIDARGYAEQIKNQIPESKLENSVTPISTSESGGEDYRQDNARAPPEGKYESKTVSELPSDFESKNESDHYKKLIEVGKEAFNASAGNEIAEGATYKELSSTEKENLSNKCKEIMNSIPKEARGNFRVPEPEKIKGVTAEGRIIEAWKPNTDGAVDGSRHMEVPKKGQVIDRIGGENGNYFSPVGENGQGASLKERAIGDYLPEKKISDNTSYHSYEILKDFTRENFQNAITNSDLSPAEKINLRGKFESYYADSANAFSKDHTGDVYCENAKSADGVKTGTIAPMFQADDGGAKQYITPFSCDELKQLGMINDA